MKSRAVETNLFHGSNTAKGHARLKCSNWENFRTGISGMRPHAPIPPGWAMVIGRTCRSATNRIKPFAAPLLPAALDTTITGFTQQSVPETRSSGSYGACFRPCLNPMILMKYRSVPCIPADPAEPRSGQTIHASNSNQFCPPPSKPSSVPLQIVSSLAEVGPFNPRASWNKPCCHSCAAQCLLGE